MQHCWHAETTPILNRPAYSEPIRCCYCGILEIRERNPAGHGKFAPLSSLGLTEYPQGECPKRSFFSS